MVTANFQRNGEKTDVVSVDTKIIKISLEDDFQFMEFFFEKLIVSEMFKLVVGNDLISPYHSGFC